MIKFKNILEENETYNSNKTIVQSNEVYFGNLSDSTKDDICSELCEDVKIINDMELFSPDLEQYLNDLTIENEPKFIIKKLSTELMFKQMVEQRGDRCSKIAVKLLMDKIQTIGDLDPILIRNGKFEDGGHRTTAYHNLKIKMIPTIEIGFLFNADWKSFFNGFEINWKTGKAIKNNNVKQVFGQSSEQIEYYKNINKDLKARPHNIDL